MAAPVLQILKNGQDFRSLTLEAGEVLLGRAEGCVVRLDDRAVSRQHAVLRSGPGGLSIEKKSHLAPLVVNGVDCESATLNEGDEVRIGPYVLRIVMPQAQPQMQPDSAGVSSAIPPAVPVDSTSLLELPSGAESEAVPDAGEVPQSGGVPDLSVPLSFEQPALPSAGGEPSVDFESISLENAPKAPLQPEELSAMVDDSARTRVMSTEAVVRLKLRFGAGRANFEEREFDQEEVSIGRGQGCDAVIDDRKASRKHAVIRRRGSGAASEYVLLDLDSVNGIFVNGARVKEHVLTGDEVFRIGDTEFSAQAVAPGYESRAQQFLRVEAEAPIHEDEGVIAGMARIGETPTPQVQAPAAMSPGFSAGIPSGGTGGFSNVAGVPGIAGTSTSGMSLLERYRAMPPRSRYIWLTFLGMLVYTAFDQYEQLSATAPAASATKPQTATTARSESKSPAAGDKAPATGAPGEAATLTYEQLAPDLKKFVDSQYNLALEYFRNRDYDRALYEVRKIFQYVSDYRDARDLERYSVEKKQSLQAQEEERKRRELEQANKAKVASLIIEVEGHMARKEYVQARELFAQVVALDPENAQIAVWRREIEQDEERRARERQLEQLARESRERAQQVMASADRALKERRWFRAIEVYESVLQLDLRDSKLQARARQGIARARAGIAAARDPLLAEAKALEQQGTLAEAYRKFAAARAADPGSREAAAGMARIRGVLRDKAKLLYTEGVLAESYSDFPMARSKFEQILQTVPEDDDYHERARRKLSRYLLKDGESR